MAGFDGEAFGKFIVEEVNASIARSIAPLLARLDALEADSGVVKEVRKDLRDIVETVGAIPVVKPDDIKAMVDDAVSKAVEHEDTIQVIEVLADKAVAHFAKDIQPPKDVDMDAVRAMIVEGCKDIRAGLESTIGPELQEALSVQVAEAIKAIPVPELPDIAGMVAEAVKAIPVPEAPQLPDIPAMVKEAVDAIELPPAPELPDIAGMITEAVKAIELPEPPVYDLPDIPAMVKEAVDAIELPPAPQLPDIPAMVKEAVDAIPIPQAPDITPHVIDLQKRVANGMRERFEEFRRDIMAIPKPQDGKSVTLDDVRPLIDDAVSKAVAQIPVPKDGVDAMECLIDQGGNLVVTLSNGATKNVGRVVGRDVDMVDVRERVQKMFDEMPKPKDGLGFDDLTVDYDGERTFKFVMRRGDTVKEFPVSVPMVLDRGIFVDGKSYERGDSVTWAGSSWIAQVDGATKKPGEGNNEWRLAVKRGKAGKDGVMTVPKEPKPVKLGER
jgi:hypothetical protein